MTPKTLLWIHYMDVYPKTLLAASAGPFVRFAPAAFPVAWPQPQQFAPTAVNLGGAHQWWYLLTISNHPILIISIGKASVLGALYGQTWSFSPDIRALQDLPLVNWHGNGESSSWSPGVPVFDWHRRGWCWLGRGFMGLHEVSLRASEQTVRGWTNLKPCIIISNWPYYLFIPNKSNSNQH